MKNETENLALISDLSIHTIVSDKCLVKNISFHVAKGECLGIVGESGSGKTLCCKALMKLLPFGLRASGQALFENTDMLQASERQARQIRGTGISAILQQPMTSFDPLYTMGAQLSEVLREKLGLEKKEARERTLNILKKVNLGEGVYSKYPHQLSGGMLQRCMIALSLALGSKLVVADEPTTALDAQNQFEVLQRLKRMREKYGVTLIFISHDLGAVQMLADRVLVMHKGERVEYGNAKEIFNHPQKEYTKYLVNTRLTLTHSFEKAIGAFNGKR